MKVDGTYTFDGPVEVVWRLLQDPDVLVKSLPGGKELEETSPDHFEGTMHIGVGPVTAALFKVTIDLHDKVDLDSYKMTVNGTSPIGFTRGSASVELETPEEGKTTMTYAADLQIGGKIAGVGQRLLDTVSKAMTSHGLKSLNKELKRRIAEESDA